MSKPFRIAIFASGNGSNFQAIVDAVERGKLDVRIELLVCDRPKAFVVERAERAGIPAFMFRPKEYASREQYEAEILQRLEELDIDLVVLAGYMRLVSPVLVEPYYGKMINIHPALLPLFPGLDAVRQAYEYGVKVTGATVHYVDGGMDTGPIIAQKAVDIDWDDTEETLAAKIHKAEHELLPQAIQWISEGRIRLEGRQTRYSKDGM